MSRLHIGSGWWHDALPRSSLQILSLSFILSGSNVGLTDPLPSIALQGALPDSAHQTEGPNDLRDMVVGIDTGVGAVRLFSGTGKQLRTMGPDVVEESGGRRRLRTYYAPDTHPGQDRMLCVRCEETWTRPPKHAGPDLIDMTCAVVEVSILDQRERIILAGDPARPVTSPVYSPDGRLLAVLEDEGISINDAEDGHLVSTIPGVLAHRPGRRNPYAQLVYVQSDGLYIRWSADASAIFVVGPQDVPDDTILNMSEAQDGSSGNNEVPLGQSPYGYTGIVEADTRTKLIRQQNVYLPLSGGRRNPGRHVEIRDKRWTWVDEQLPNTEAVRALFGSPVHPVFKPSVSPARGFYFYLHYDEGWFWKTALMRVDTETGRVKNINTLARGLYRE